MAQTGGVEFDPIKKPIFPISVSLKRVKISGMEVISNNDIPEIDE